ncbi:MAG: asparagine synthase (glutamine-hydrolyzing) [Clostridiales bacterium]|jgi:asparagine synthase (glutamine-hydrolysing)|nr:asparagine synthase (glutamine-hydrolyzing) [Clostridiales bacterium]
MCGITGWLDFKKDLRNERDTAKKMSEALKKRGPDEADLYARPEVVLCHRRLIILDPRGGGQPMTKREKGDTFTIVYNGMLYNAAELRKSLLACGYRFSGYSDTEVVLLAFIEWGAACLVRFNGIFAFAVYRENDKRLFLARDRIGVKPLFYYRTPDGLLFASEIKALFQNPLIVPKIGEEGLKQIFYLGPGRVPGSGVFSGIEELKPAEYLELTPAGMTKKIYWTLRADENNETEADALAHVRALITDSIERQLISDVPLACFLSGGLDSSIITYVTAQKFSAENKKLTTYSVDYADSGKYFTKNEFQPTADGGFISLMADFVGSDHKNVVLDNVALAQALAEAAEARDLPGMADIDASLLLFCREVKRTHTVCLSGECADEIFGGYPWYHDKKILYSDTFPWSRSLEMRKRILRPGLLTGSAEDFVRARYRTTLRHTDRLPGEDRHARRMREMFMLNFEWFMQTLIDRNDRMSMSAGLEARVPFCDYRLVEYAYNLPWHLKAADGREKGLVRKAFSGILPDEIVCRKKSPYPKTFSPAYLSCVKAGAEKILADPNSPVGQLVDHEYVKTLMAADPYKSEPWYGQLMRIPQVFAYLMQTDALFKKFKVKIV